MRNIDPAMTMVYTKCLESSFKLDSSLTSSTFIQVMLLSFVKLPERRWRFGYVESAQSCRETARTRLSGSDKIVCSQDHCQALEYKKG